MLRHSAACRSHFLYWNLAMVFDSAIHFLCAACTQGTLTISYLLGTAWFQFVNRLEGFLVDLPQSFNWKTHNPGWHLNNIFNVFVLFTEIVDQLKNSLNFGGDGPGRKKEDGRFHGGQLKWKMQVLFVLNYRVQWRLVWKRSMSQGQFYKLDFVGKS